MPIRLTKTPPVLSVNGQIGAVTLGYSDVGAAPSSHVDLTTSAHGGIVASTDSRLTNARTPTAHASTHASAGSDPLSLAGSQITSGTVANARTTGVSTATASTLGLRDANADIAFRNVDASQIGGSHPLLLTGTGSVMLKNAQSSVYNYIDLQPSADSSPAHYYSGYVFSLSDNFSVFYHHVQTSGSGGGGASDVKYVASWAKDGTTYLSLTTSQKLKFSGDAYLYRNAANSLRTAGAFVVDGLASALHFKGSSSTPTVAAGSGAGTSPTCTVSGTDASFRLNVTPGSSPSASNAIIATVTFNVAYGATPVIAWSPSNAAAAALSGANEPYWDRAASTSTTMVFKCGTSALTATTAYEWTFHVIQ